MDSIALCAWLSLVVINGIITFMLSPGKGWSSSHAMWDGFFNATYLSSLFLRSFVALALGGLWGLAAGAVAAPDLKPRILKPAALCIQALRELDPAMNQEQQHVHGPVHQESLWGGFEQSCVQQSERGRGGSSMFRLLDAAQVVDVAG